MGPNTTGFGGGSIIIGLLLMLAVAAVIFMFGVWAVAQLRRGRVNEETDISYPAVPQGADDRRAVEQVQAREKSGTLQADNATDMELHEQAVSQSMQPVRQSPTQAERPADATYKRGVAPNSDTSEAQDDRSPL